MILLLKFNDEKYIRTLRKKGEIFMNSPSSFKKNDANKERFDRFEGAKTNEFIKKGIIELRDKDINEWKKLSIFNSNLNYFGDYTDYYLYSLYYITLEDLKSTDIFQIDTRMREFGSHFLMIRTPGEFLSKIKTYLDDNKYEYSFNSITYYDTKQGQKNLTLFHKPDNLKHQKEYRIIVKARMKTKPLLFRIGGIENCSEIFQTKNLESFALRL